MSTLWVTLAVLGGACGNEEGDDPPDASVAADAAPAFDASAPDADPCAPGERPVDDGGCAPPGIVACGPGLQDDGEGGCRAVLPEEPCADGTMALPGDRRCAEVAPCGDGPWGTIEVDETTRFVDASYAGGDADGTRDRPFPAVQAAIDVAAPGATVAIAAGSYPEGAVIAAKPVRLRGRCPALVELGPTDLTVVVGAGADGTVVQGITITGSDVGLVVTDALDVAIEEVRVHDTGGFGVLVGDGLGPATATMRRILVERARIAGVAFSGVTAEASELVVTGTQPTSDFAVSRGLSVEAGNGGVALITVRHALLADNVGGGVTVVGSTVTIEDTVVRGSLPSGAGEFGRGIDLESETRGARGDVTLRNVLVEDSYDIGILVAGLDATIESSMVRDTAPRASDGAMGRGLQIQRNVDDGAIAEATVRASTIEASHEAGVAVISAVATLESVRIRDTAPLAPETPGIGLVCTVDGDVIEDPGPTSTLALRWSAVERSVMVGVSLFGCDAGIERTRIADTAATPGGLFGDGVVLLGSALPVAATIAGSLVSGSARAGVASFSGRVAIEDTTLSCNPIALDGEDLVGAFTFDDAGGNVCECDGASEPCVVRSARLEPPAPIAN